MLKNIANNLPDSIRLLASITMTTSLFIHGQISFGWGMLGFVLLDIINLIAYEDKTLDTEIKN